MGTGAFLCLELCFRVKSLPLADFSPPSLLVISSTAVNVPDSKFVSALLISKVLLNSPVAYWVIQQHLASTIKNLNLIIFFYKPTYSHTPYFGGTSWVILDSYLSAITEHWLHDQILLISTSLTTLEIPFSSTVLLRIKTKSLEGSLALPLNQATSNTAANGLSLWWLFSC